MIVVTIVAITGILATIITGFTLQAVTRTLMTDVINGTVSDNENILDVYERVEVYGTNIVMWSTVGAVIGLMIWVFLSSQQRESVTGVYG